MRVCRLLTAASSVMFGTANAHGHVRIFAFLPIFAVPYITNRPSAISVGYIMVLVRVMVKVSVSRR